MEVLGLEKNIINYIQIGRETDECKLRVP